MTTNDQEQSASVRYEDTRELGPLPREWRSLSAAFLRQVRRDSAHPALADSLGAALSYRQVLMRAVALGRVLRRCLSEANYVGVLMPPTVPGAVSNLSLTLLGRVPVNLNYTASKEALDSSIEQCGMTHVVTSRRSLEKLKVQPKAELIYLEDIPARVNLGDKLLAGLAPFLPDLVLSSFLPGLRGNRLGEVATVIFTSGSTGDPKGVMLSHGNILSNSQGILQQVDLSPRDVVLGILPFFHSFGFTVTLWTALVLGLKAVYHFNPLDAKIIGNLAAEHGATVLAATPTFMRSYIQRCPAEQFKTLRLLIVGAEKLKPELAQEIKRRIGVEPLEGYGCTETGPVVSVNTPGRVPTTGEREIPGNRWGTVGRPLPSTRIKTVDYDTESDLSPGREGVICVKGPQVMMGYLNQPEATAKVLKDGWYSTGDLGYVDEDGFLKITDRLSRFSKVGGEMVPHQGVEAALAATGLLDDATFVVTSIPDAKRGERLIVVHTPFKESPAAVSQKLLRENVPRLWIPSADDFVAVQAIPVLGSGKVDLRAVRELAEAGAGARGRAEPVS
jgi:acyl-[acyl-carrier-protein]-phospholipid O-acyltransferase/long-chain-fatty-acid--[acyl-carrier-protein] ligase